MSYQMAHDLRERFAEAIADSRNVSPDGASRTDVLILPEAGDFNAADACIRTLHDPGIRRYSRDQQRVADWLNNRAGIGGGDDPIGFLLASYEMIHGQLQDHQALRAVCEAFVQDHSIHCAETIYQTDGVIQAAPEFIEAVCDVVGYQIPDEEKDEDSQ